MLTVKFESLKIKDYEACSEFYTELNDNINFCFNLGERTCNSKW